MRQRVLVVLAAVLVSVSTGMAPARAVSEGAPVADGSSTFVAKINVGDARACTGALVGPQWVLTASGCFAVGGQPVSTGAPALATTATVGRANLAGAAGRKVPVTRIVPHPSRDVVLAKLALRVTDIAPIAVGGAAPAVGDALRTAGYGRTATEWVPDRLQATPAVVGAVAAGSFGWTGPAGSAAGACLGDAGGPVFRTGGSQPQLVGVTIAAGQGGCLAKPDGARGATAVRVDDLASWVTQNALEPTTSFRNYHHSATGIGGYDLASGADLIVPFDYDHSGKQDHLLLYRPGTGTVWILKHTASDTYTQVFASQTGIGGYDLASPADRILPFDYDHSGKLDHLLIYRPGGRTAFVVKHGTGNTFTAVYATVTAGIGDADLADARDQIVAYDYEHTGKPDHLVVYRPGTGQILVIKHGTGNTFSSVFQSGTGIGGYDLAISTDRIVPFDYDHSGKLDHLVLYRPGGHTAWVVKHGAGNAFSAVFHSATGIGGYDLLDTRDQLVAYDYERTGKLDHLVLYRPGEGAAWVLKHGAGNAFSAVFHSATGIGGYDLKSGADRIVAFDDEHAGAQSHLVLYRPGNQIAWVVGRNESAGAAPITVRPASGPDSLVEDFTHPGAAQILAEHQLEVFKGDGHIVFVTSRSFAEGQCPTGQIQVEKELDAEPYGVFYCFRTIGTQGVLTLKVPGTFGVRGGDKPIVATADLPTGEREYPVPANGFVAIEPGTGSELPQAVLVELRLGP
ncbi:trypsin-like serine protease [Actinomycetes bacterium KLBMP 9797]